MTKLDVELPEQLREWVESRVESGRYTDAGDYIRDLLRHDRRSVSRRTDRLHAMIAEGVADLEAGRVHDIDEVFAEVYAIIDAEEAKQAAE